MTESHDGYCLLWLQPPSWAEWSPPYSHSQSSLLREGTVVSGNRAEIEKKFCSASWAAKHSFRAVWKKPIKFITIPYFYQPELFSHCLSPRQWQQSCSSLADREFDSDTKHRAIAMTMTPKKRLHVQPTLKIGSLCLCWVMDRFMWGLKVKQDPAPPLPSVSVGRSNSNDAPGLDVPMQGSKEGCGIDTHSQAKVWPAKLHPKHINKYYIYLPGLQNLGVKAMVQRQRYYIHTKTYMKWVINHHA